SIGPTTPASLRLNAQGRVDTMIGDTRVLFDGIPAPMIYAASRIVSCVVPYALANRAFTSLQVEYLGVRSPAVTVRVSQTSPGIFTLNSTGSGPGAILNQDNSINGPNNPEAKGSYIVIYATGEGQTIPPGIDGAVIGANPPQPIQRVTVTIGGQAAEVLYAGSAPSFVAGVLQINARIPESVGSGPQQVVVNAGNASSQPGVTVSVR
ncbi:MAG: hypothetical protein HY013_14890, partial [Candidatus Solibacter usitatus]|nr:hypothetical protein [Candidatus Solibacter usitatus]